MTATRAEHEWLTAVQAQAMRGGLGSAQHLLVQALAEHPASVALRRAQAGALRQTGRDADAESLLRGLLAQDPGDAASAFTLAHMLKEQGRMAAAASTLRACFAGPSNCSDANLAIQAIELLDDGNRKTEAAAIAEIAIRATPEDARLHAYAGMLQIQLGEFEQARQHYLFALAHDERAWEWHVPIGLSAAQHYETATHPDFTMFRDGLQRDALSRKAVAELHFALGKACDDIGDYPQAARHFRDGNAIAHRQTKWTRKAWRREVEARLASGPIAHTATPSPGFTPVFIVGMPRSGTTLLAQLLSRYPRVCNRGELPWIARLAGRPALTGSPDQGDLQAAAATYTAQARQDDAGDARWFVDKQPLNFRYLDLMLSMFPQATVIHCRRNARDTALSLWMQCFLEEVQGYSYDFDDIAIVMRDCDRLMAHWQERFPAAIRSVHYEQLVASPQDVIASLVAWIGLEAPPVNAPDGNATRGGTISTASLWQARQPVNTRSVGRWKDYAPHVPELLRITES